MIQGNTVSIGVSFFPDNKPLNRLRRGRASGSNSGGTPNRGTKREPSFSPEKSATTGQLSAASKPAQTKSNSNNSNTPGARKSGRRSYSAKSVGEGGSNGAGQSSQVVMEKNSEVSAGSTIMPLTSSTTADQTNNGTKVRSKMSFHGTPDSLTLNTVLAISL